jgi:hypothetical protein
LNYLAPGVEIATVGATHATLMPLLRNMGLRNGIKVAPR